MSVSAPKYISLDLRGVESLGQPKIERSMIESKATPVLLTFVAAENVAALSFGNNRSLRLYLI
jgi:hypothetical protein